MKRKNKSLIALFSCFVLFVFITPVQAKGECDGLLTVEAMEFIEEIIVPAVGRNNLQLTAPCDARIGNVVQPFRIFMERKLIQDTRTALSGLRIDIRGHHRQCTSIIQPQNGIPGMLRVQHLPIDRLIEYLRKRLAVLQKQTGLLTISGTDPIMRSR